MLVSFYERFNSWDCTVQKTRVGPRYIFGNWEGCSRGTCRCCESIQVLALNGRCLRAFQPLRRQIGSFLWGLDFNQPELHLTPTQVWIMSVVYVQFPSHILLSQELCWESGEVSELGGVLPSGSLSGDVRTSRWKHLWIGCHIPATL